MGQQLIHFFDDPSNIDTTVGNVYVSDNTVMPTYNDGYIPRIGFADQTYVGNLFKTRTRNKIEGAGVKGSLVPRSYTVRYFGGLLCEAPDGANLNGRFDMTDRLAYATCAPFGVKLKLTRMRTGGATGSAISAADQIIFLFVNPTTGAVIENPTSRTGLSLPQIGFVFRFSSHFGTGNDKRIYCRLHFLYNDGTFSGNVRDYAIMQFPTSVIDNTKVGIKILDNFQSVFILEQSGVSTFLDAGGNSTLKNINPIYFPNDVITPNGQLNDSNNQPFKIAIGFATDYTTQYSYTLYHDIDWSEIEILRSV